MKIAIYDLIYKILIHVKLQNHIYYIWQSVFQILKYHLLKKIPEYFLFDYF